MADTTTLKPEDRKLAEKIVATAAKLSAADAKELVAKMPEDQIVALMEQRTDLAACRQILGLGDPPKAPPAAEAGETAAPATAPVPICPRNPAHRSTRVYRTNRGTDFCVCDDCGTRFQRSQEGGIDAGELAAIESAVRALLGDLQKRGNGLAGTITVRLSHAGQALGRPLTVAAG